jgi:hypothetical protein
MDRAFAAASASNAGSRVEGEKGAEHYPQAGDNLWIRPHQQTDAERELDIVLTRWLIDGRHLGCG